MSFDYSKALELAQKAVRNYGRTISLVELGVATDETKPWSSPVGTETLKEASGLFVEPGAASKLGLNVDLTDFLKRSKQICVVATSEDLRKYHQIKDGNQYWTITGMSALKPGDLAVLWFIGVGE